MSVCADYRCVPGICMGHCRPLPQTVPMPPYHFQSDGPFPAGMTIPKGCICPPTSERTCKRKDCGRKEAS